MNLNNIQDKYGNFSDSWIEVSSIKRKGSGLKLEITCANILNDFKYENVIIVFEEIKNDTLSDNVFSNDTFVVKDALICTKESDIIVDFDPLDYFDFLKENQQSNFKITCKKIRTEFLSFY